VPDGKAQHALRSWASHPASFPQKDLFSTWQAGTWLLSKAGSGGQSKAIGPVPAPEAASHQVLLLNARAAHLQLAVSPGVVKAGLISNDDHDVSSF
jgi:hypothetical protein